MRTCKSLPLALFWIVTGMLTASCFKKQSAPALSMPTPFPCQLEPNEEVSPACARSYRCPPQPVPNGVTAAGLFLKGELAAVIGVDPSGNLQKLSPAHLAEAKNGFWGTPQRPAKVISYDVSYDGIEADRCDFKFEISPSINHEDGFLTLSQSKKFSLKFRSALAPEVHALGRKFKICKKKTCESEEEWNVHKILGVSDLNQNGNPEIWSSFVSGYRTFYAAHEWDLKKSTLTEVAFY